MMVVIQLLTISSPITDPDYCYPSFNNKSNYSADIVNAVKESPYSC